MDFEELLSRVALAFGIRPPDRHRTGLAHSRCSAWQARQRGYAPLLYRDCWVESLQRWRKEQAVRLSIGGSILLGTAFLAYAGVITTFIRDQNRSAGVFSATTTIAALLTFMLGAYALLGDVRIAAASGVITAGVLSFVKGFTAGWRSSHWRNSNPG